MTDDQLWWASAAGFALGVFFALIGVLFLSVLMLGTGGVFWVVMHRRDRDRVDPFVEIEEWANRREDREP